MLDYVGYFLMYSFAGFLLETVYAMVVQGAFVVRKCFLISPLCPVYGFGAIAVLLATRSFRQNPFAVFVLGMLASSAVEYITDVVYRELMGVTFWDYGDMPFNLNGRICLFFSLAWGLLSVVLVKFLHPGVDTLVKSSPRWLWVVLGIFLLIDAVASSVVLVRFKDKNMLNLFS